MRCFAVTATIAIFFLATTTMPGSADSKVKSQFNSGSQHQRQFRRPTRRSEPGPAELGVAELGLAELGFAELGYEERASR